MTGRAACGPSGASAASVLLAFGRSASFACGALGVRATAIEAGDLSMLGDARH
ncbi:conserved hypothetical protein [Burkholderia pseudomallei 668]|nr:conserved hypothetical protein [Burkholderia pseudomallei 668]